jgi:hypothetical protein
MAAHTNKNKPRAVGTPVRGYEFRPRQALIPGGAGGWGGSKRKIGHKSVHALGTYCYSERLRSLLSLIVVIAVLRSPNRLTSCRIDKMDPFASRTPH